MKILVFDDTEKNRASAKLLFAEKHALTIVSTYDEAQTALAPKMDYEKSKTIMSDLLEKAGLARDFNPYSGDHSDEERVRYSALHKQAVELATMYPDFDVVLTDLLVPASRQAQGPNGAEFVGQEMPLGTTIALLALAVGIRNVAVVTDKNHHDHPASAAFDCFGHYMPKLESFNLICTNRVHSVALDEKTGKLLEDDFLASEAGKIMYPYPTGQTWGNRAGVVRGGKDWKPAFDALFGIKSE